MSRKIEKAVSRTKIERAVAVNMYGKPDALLTGLGNLAYGAGVCFLAKFGVFRPTDRQIAAAVNHLLGRKSFLNEKLPL